MKSNLAISLSYLILTVAYQLFETESTQCDNCTKVVNVAIELEEEIHLSFGLPDANCTELNNDGAIIVDKTPCLITVDINTSASLHCQSTGNPKPNVTWWRGGDKLPSTDQNYEMYPNNTLLIKSVDSKLIGEYSCLAYNGHCKPARKSYEVQLNTPIRKASEAINSNETKISDYPHHVSIEWPSNNIMYNGAIINEHWALSSGYRWVIEPERPCLIRAGTNTKGHGGSVHPVDKIIRSLERLQNELRTTAENDLALIHVTEPFVLDMSHRPIELFKTKPAPGTTATVTFFDNKNSLMVRKMTVIELEECRSAYEHKFRDMKGMVCLEHDSELVKVLDRGLGAPLVVNGKLAGLAGSGFYLLDKPRRPLLFTEITSHQKWIQNQTNERVPSD